MTKADQVPFPFFTTELPANDSNDELITDREPTAVITMCSDDEWEGILENVRERVRFPRGHKVEFRRADPSEDPSRLGWTAKPGRRTFEIVVWNNLSYDHTIDLVIHELAHVLNWQEYTPWRDDHSPTFWVYLGEVYCAYHQVR